MQQNDSGRPPACGICCRELHQEDLYLVLPRTWFPWAEQAGERVVVCDRCLALLVGAGWGLLG